MPRVNVYLRDELLDAVNREAKHEKTKRSALIQVALEKDIEDKRHEREEQEKRKKMAEASRKMDALARKLGAWDPQAIIRKSRDTNLNGVSNVVPLRERKFSAIKRKG